jgi:hypothetical protein
VGIKAEDLGGLNDGVVVGPSSFKAVGEEFNGLGAIGIPDEKAGCGSAKSGDQQEHIFHGADSSSCCDLRLFGDPRRRIWVGCEEGFSGYSGCSIRRVSRLDEKRLHFGYGFGSIRPGAWGWRARGGKDGGDGCGCGYGSESFGEGSDARES